MGKKRINIEAALEITVLLGFATFFLIALRSGSVQYYVHPRIVPYMWFGAAAFVLVSLSMAGELFKPRRRNPRLLRYMIFIVPLLMAFMLPPKAKDTGSVALGSIGSSGKTGGSTAGSSSESEASGVYPEEDIYSRTYPNAGARDSRIDVSADMIEMNERNFVQWLQELYENGDRYEGKSIQIVGFVFKDKDFQENQFVPARFMMSCCAADMQPVGLLCNYGNAGILERDSWVKVQGTVKSGEFQGERVPMVEVERVEAAEKPKIEYVYPY